ncbi:cob(I)yrinic acid a,c-diamide adenosyltransferase [Methylobacillus gramineus]|uniref:cob(I)yrinic acid a,c-diamide adenosyltransferase n=1 Tax=Methylobacillus gramineus TaxID=755169 RepID=UPI001D000B48|nr:cob(I)yrinic acid a,c-diamide adenosyltransferase [Methylobacillus gramineus]MCB5185077.1 cob(I)yrinic acid a,c-diamide adenosyltransferase [Methylobacillus gramineus]
MGNRLSKIYTRTGDDGTTGLGDGSRIDKDSLRVEAMGTVDELNAILGILLTDALPANISHMLTLIQHDLFDLGGELSIPGHTLLPSHRTDALEQLLDTLNAELPPLKEFILPGGTTAAAYCHLGRTVCRRAERILIALSRQQNIGPVAIPYINRLSDLLFVMSRSLNKSAGSNDVLWKHQR